MNDEHTVWRWWVCNGLGGSAKVDAWRILKRMCDMIRFGFPGLLALIAPVIASDSSGAICHLVSAISGR